MDPETGNLFITDGYGNSRVHQLTAEGAHIRSWGTSGTDPGEFNLPHNVCMVPKQRLIAVVRPPPPIPHSLPAQRRLAGGS